MSDFWGGVVLDDKVRDVLMRMGGWFGVEKILGMKLLSCWEVRWGMGFLCR